MWQYVFTGYTTFLTGALKMMDMKLTDQFAVHLQGMKLQDMNNNG